MPTESSDPPRRCIAVDDPFAGGLAEILHDGAELGFRCRRVPLSDHFPQLADFGADARLYPTVAGTTLQILAIALDC
jgi:hypothetical protein